MTLVEEIALKRGVDDNRKLRYHKRVQEYGGHKLTLWSLDGLTWSTNKDELITIIDRQDEAHARFGGQIRGGQQGGKQTGEYTTAATPQRSLKVTREIVDVAAEDGAPGNFETVTDDASKDAKPKKPQPKVGRQAASQGETKPKSALQNKTLNTKVAVSPKVPQGKKVDKVVADTKATAIAKSAKQGSVKTTVKGALIDKSPVTKGATSPSKKDATKKATPVAKAAKGTSKGAVKNSAPDKLGAKKPGKNLTTEKKGVNSKNTGKKTTSTKAIPKKTSLKKKR